MIPDDDQDFLDYCAVQVLASLVRRGLPLTTRQYAERAYEHADMLLDERRRRRAAIEAAEEKSKRGSGSSGAEEAEEAEDIPGTWWRDR